MQKTELIDAIYQVLDEKLNAPNLSEFSKSARLNEDLYLDSVLIMQLLVNLELELGIDIPDSALSHEDFETVSSFADFLLSQCANEDRKNEQEFEGSSSEPVQEEFEDIKVHCFVSSVCEIIKADDRVDHRPFYFGVWDAEVVIDENHCITYHSPDINHNFFKTWYEKLYGVPITQWYRHDVSKNDNVKTFLHLLDNKTETQRIMVMLDMYRLPERENKFNRNPFPHYVMLEKTDDPEIWFMWDPDFRWEGPQKKSQVLHAIESEEVGGGYIFDSQNIQPTTDEALYEYFQACFNSEHNPMTDAVRAIIHAHTSSPQLAPLSNLDEALVQLPVLAIRKYAYEHGLAFFWRELGLNDDEFESWCDVIEELVSTYKHIQFRAMKMSVLTEIDEAGKQLLSEINEFLDQQDKREFKIKARLYEVFFQWCTRKNLTEKELTEEQHEIA